MERNVAIHNKNGKGLLHVVTGDWKDTFNNVAIHNKNGKGLLLPYLNLLNKADTAGRNPQ